MHCTLLELGLKRLHFPVFFGNGQLDGIAFVSDEPTSGLKPEKDNFDYTMEESEKGYENFTVIQCKVKSFEWLYLAAKGHRRARFDLENDKRVWLVP